MSFDLKIKQGSLVLRNGKLQTVENTDKLVQDSLKEVTTPRGINKYHPSYGCKISSNIIGSGMDDTFTSKMLEGEIRNALENKQKRQRDQSLRQKLTPGEILAAIQNIVVMRNQIDPRYFSIMIYILSGSLTQHEMNISAQL